jgi:hypothetical protein
MNKAQACCLQPPPCAISTTSESALIVMAFKSNASDCNESPGVSVMRTSLQESSGSGSILLGLQEAHPIKKSSNGAHEQCFKCRLMINGIPCYFALLSRFFS